MATATQTRKTSCLDWLLFRQKLTIAPPDKPCRARNASVEWLQISCCQVTIKVDRMMPLAQCNGDFGSGRRDRFALEARRPAFLKAANAAAVGALVLQISVCRQVPRFFDGNPK